jgi:aspartyl-tRNA synthetase
MKTKIGYVAYRLLDIRQATIFHFCRDFDINIYSEIVNYSADKPEKDLNLSLQFVEFLIRNKNFLKNFEDDFYQNKSVESIAIKTGRELHEIENHKLQIKSGIPISIYFIL